MHVSYNENISPFLDAMESVNRKTPLDGLVAAQDRMIDPGAQRALAKKIGATTTVLPTSHVPMASDPESVAKVIVEAARGGEVSQARIAAGGCNDPRQLVEAAQKLKAYEIAGLILPAGRSEKRAGSNAHRPSRAVERVPFCRASMSGPGPRLCENSHAAGKIQAPVDWCPA